MNQDDINKEVPKLRDRTVHNSKFEISLADQEIANDRKNFSTSKNSPVAFWVSEASVGNPCSRLFVRAMIVDDESPEKAIICRELEHGDDSLAIHILRCENPDSKYTGDENGIYADERFSVLTPLVPN